MEKYLRIRHVELAHLETSGLWTAMTEEASFPDGQLADKIKSVVADCRTCCQKRAAAYEESEGTIWGRYPWDEVFIDCLTTIPET